MALCVTALIVNIELWFKISQFNWNFIEVIFAQNIYIIATALNFLYYY